MQNYPHTRVRIVATNDSLPIEYRADGMLYPTGLVTVLSDFKDGDTVFSPKDSDTTISATFIVLPDGKQLDVSEKKEGIYVRDDLRHSSSISFEHEGVSIDNPFISSCGRFGAKPEDYGFSVWDIGGGTKGYGLYLPDGGYILITNLEGDNLPSGESDALIGQYSKDGEEVNCHKLLTAEQLNKRLGGGTHRDLYPEQYAHPLCGKRVRIEGTPEVIEGVVERVVSSRFGRLAILEGGKNQAWALSSVKEL